MATIGVRWGATPDVGAGASSLGAALASAFDPTANAIGMLKIDAMKAHNEEMRRRAGLIDAQTALTTSKNQSEQQGIQGRNLAAPAAGNIAAGQVAPAIVEGPMPKGQFGPGMPVEDRSSPAYLQRQKDARDFATGNTLASTSATDMATGAGKTAGMIGTLYGPANADIQRKDALLYTNKAPDKNDVLGSFDNVGIDAAIREKTAENASKPPTPVMVNGKPYMQTGQIGPDGRPVLTPYAGVPDMPFGTGDKADMLSTLSAIKQKEAAGVPLSQQETVQKSLIEQQLQGQHVTRESDSARRDRIVAETNAAVRAGRLDQVDPDAYAMAYTQNGYGPKDDFREVQGQLTRITTNSAVPALIPPEQLYQMRGMGPRTAPAPAGSGAPFDPGQPASPIIDPKYVPQAQAPAAAPDRTTVTPIGEPKPMDLKEYQQKVVSTAIRVARPAAFFDRMTPEQIPGILQSVLAGMATGQPITVGMLANRAVTPEARTYLQNALTYLNPALRLESGATVLPPEYAMRWLQEIPLPGDTQKDLTEKRVARAHFYRSLMVGLPPQAQKEIQQIVSSASYDPNFDAPLSPPAGGQTRTLPPVGQSHTIGNVTIERVE